MKTASTILSVLFLASCSALDVDAVRVGGSLSDFRAKATASVGDESFTSEDPGDTRGATVELTNHVSDNTDVGLRLGYGQGSIQDVDLQTYDVEGVARYFLTEGPVRPYLAGSLSYRRAELRDDFFGSGHSDMFTAGAGAGLQYDMGGGFHLFGEALYQGAFGDDFTTHGPTFMIGGGVSF